ncbi:sigma-70 family RNA polymerase sigma factor [Alteromonas sp. S167]|uniref:sigma-70 family RNA polymerase sigma factor n=1 Tax=Alteromonas sp. S167 TaxID=3117402 RepID=UPI002FE4157B
MNRLISIGIKTESLTIIQKYTSNCSFQDELIKKIFSKSLELNKLKILVFLFDKFGRELLESLNDEQLEKINKKAEHYEKLALVLDSKGQVEPAIALQNGRELSQYSDWESDDDDTTFQASDSQILSTIAELDKKVSTVTLSQEGEFWDEVSSELLPKANSLTQNFSKFIHKNKSSLRKFYSSDVNPNLRSEELKKLFGDDFDDSELLIAIEKLDSDIENFDDWLEALDSFLANSSNPKLSNPAYYGYFGDLAKDICKPLSAHEESSITLKIQNNCYALLFGLDNKQYQEVIENISTEFNEERDNPYISFDFDSNREFIVKDSLDTMLSTRTAFIKPLSFIRLLRNTCDLSFELQRVIEEIHQLVSEFQLSNLRLVISLVKKYKKFYADDYLDLVQEGNIAILSALNKFEPRKGYKFSTYATWWIKQALTRYIDSNISTVRVPVHMAEKVKKVQFYFREQGIALSSETLKEAEFDEISLKTDITISELSSFHQMLFWREEIENIDNLQIYEPKSNDDSVQFIEKLFEGETLKEKEKLIITYRFGLNGNYERTLEEVGQELGVTRERIRQIEAKALEKLEVKAGLLIDSAPTAYGESINE